MHFLCVIDSDKPFFNSIERARGTSGNEVESSKKPFDTSDSIVKRAEATSNRARAGVNRSRAHTNERELGFKCPENEQFDIRDNTDIL